ncbi:hypothetical protein POTOM_033238 [Populus tomentosa]|uniref:F-box domain-containing protein n=1 Tax=Populus tomentosa TaxID=118781 RepID=A0A8X7Z3Z9_POPTO|nr:hypothetical protein POTOM_033238 [Populus tomentosa]
MGTAGTLNRFRNLPDKIVHQILLFISMGELARLRLVSKRCKRLCFTIPHRTFDNRTHRPIDPDRQIQHNLFLNRWMDLRQDDGIKISTLYLNWSFEGSYSYEEFYVGKSQAAGSEVELLKIEVITRSGSAFELPVPVLKCEPLKILMLYSTNQGIVRFPSLSSSYFYILKQLKLENVHPDQKNPTCLVLAWYPYNLGSSLTLSTPKLKNILWYGYHQSYTISAFLETFQLNFTSLPYTYLPDLSQVLHCGLHQIVQKRKKKKKRPSSRVCSCQKDASEFCKSLEKIWNFKSSHDIFLAMFQAHVKKEEGGEHAGRYWEHLGLYLVHRLEE